MRLHPKTVVSEILNNFSENETASSIARKINYNPKTIAKYLELLEYLGILKSYKVKIGLRTISFYDITQLISWPLTLVVLYHPSVRILQIKLI